MKVKFVITETDPVTNRKRYILENLGQGDDIRLAKQFDTYPEAEQKISEYGEGFYQIDKYFINEG